jgi:hypothetical protein
MDRKLLFAAIVIAAVLIASVYFTLYSGCIDHMEEYEPGKLCCLGLEVVTTKNGTKYCVVPGMDWFP